MSILLLFSTTMSPALLSYGTIEVGTVTYPAAATDPGLRKALNRQYIVTNKTGLKGQAAISRVVDNKKAFLFSFLTSANKKALSTTCQLYISTNQLFCLLLC